MIRASRRLDGWLRLPSQPTVRLHLVRLQNVRGAEVGHGSPEADYLPGIIRWAVVVPAAMR